MTEEIKRDYKLPVLILLAIALLAVNVQCASAGYWYFEEEFGHDSGFYGYGKIVFGDSADFIDFMFSSLGGPCTGLVLDNNDYYTGTVGDGTIWYDIYYPTGTLYVKVYDDNEIEYWIDGTSPNGQSFQNSGHTINDVDGVTDFSGWDYWEYVGDPPSVEVTANIGTLHLYDTLTSSYVVDGSVHTNWNITITSDVDGTIAYWSGIHFPATGDGVTVYSPQWFVSHNATYTMGVWALTTDGWKYDSDSDTVGEYVCPTITPGVTIPILENITVFPTSIPPLFTNMTPEEYIDTYLNDTLLDNNWTLGFFEGCDDIATGFEDTVDFVLSFLLTPLTWLLEILTAVNDEMAMVMGMGISTMQPIAVAFGSITGAFPPMLVGVVTLSLALDCIIIFLRG